MPVGLFRSDGGWVQVDYGTGTTIPVTRSKYEARPNFKVRLESTAASSLPLRATQRYCEDSVVAGLPSEAGQVY
jgi:hypothetical protein